MSQYSCIHLINIYIYLNYYSTCIVKPRVAKRLDFGWKGGRVWLLSGPLGISWDLEDTSFSGGQTLFPKGLVSLYEQRRL